MHLQTFHENQENLFFRETGLPLLFKKQCFVSPRQCTIPVLSSTISYSTVILIPLYSRIFVSIVTLFPQSKPSGDSLPPQKGPDLRSLSFPSHRTHPHLFHEICPCFFKPTDIIGMMYNSHLICLIILYFMPVRPDIVHFAPPFSLTFPRISPAQSD